MEVTNDKARDPLEAPLKIPPFYGQEICGPVSRQKCVEVVEI